MSIRFRPKVPQGFSLRLGSKVPQGFSLGSLFVRGEDGALAPGVCSPSRWQQLSLLLMVLLAATSIVAQTSTVAFNRAWWTAMDQNERWDFIYGFTDCSNPPRYKANRASLNMGQYDEFISSHVDAHPQSVPRLIRLAPRRLKASLPLAGGEIWTDKHGFNDGDLWGDHKDEGRAWVEGYLACDHRLVSISEVDRYVQLIIRHYSDPKRHLDKLANVLQPLLPPKASSKTP